MYRMRPMQWRSSSCRVEDLQVEAERVDAQRVGPVDPAVGARRMRLHGDQGVEVPADALDVRRQEDEAAVLGVEGVAVQVDELRGALVERRPHHLDDVGDRRHRLAVAGAARTFHAEAAGGALHAEPARSRGMDQQVVPEHARDAPHGDARWWCAGRRSAAPPSRLHLDAPPRPSRPDRRASTGRRRREAGTARPPCRPRRPARRRARRRRRPARGSAAAAPPDVARPCALGVDAHAARREVELDAGVDAPLTPAPAQAAQPSPAEGARR